MTSDHDELKRWRPRWSVKFTLMAVTIAGAYLPKFVPRQSERVSGHVKTKRVLTLGTCIVAVVFGGAYAMRGVIERVEENALAPYRAKAAGDLIVQYLETNNDKWPSGWEELTKDAVSSYEDAQWIADVREHVDIDFAFQLEAVDLSHELDLSRPPFRAVSLKNGVEISHLESPEPNTIIFQYLKRSSELAANQGGRKDPGETTAISGAKAEPISRPP